MLVVNWMQQSLMEPCFFIYRFHTSTSSKKFFEVTEQTEFLIRSTLSRVYCQKQSAVPSLEPLNVIDPVENQFLSHGYEYFFALSLRYDHLS